MKVSDIAWSHSALKVYTSCPHKYYREKVVKDVPFVENDAIKRGNDLHSTMEKAVRDDKPLPKRWDYPHLQELVEWARSLPAVRCEEQLAFTSELVRCEWFDRKVKVWTRAKVDLQSFFSDEVAFVLDYKTGKNWGDDGQAGLTALAMFWANPQLQSVSTCWYYVDQDQQVTDQFHRADMIDLMEAPLKTLDQIARSYKTERWQKTPGISCKFCGVTDCEFRGKGPNG